MPSLSFQQSFNQENRQKIKVEVKLKIICYMYIIINEYYHILDMIPVALPQHRAGAGLTSPCSQFQELQIVQ